MKRALVTGGFGLVGLEMQNLESNFLYPTREELDLIDETSVQNFIKKNKNTFDTVIHLAAKVGGVKANSERSSDFFIDNIKMNMNIMSACHTHNMKLVSVLSTCVYPDSKYVIYPLTEDQLHNGPPHESNFGYAYAKRMLEVQSRAYRKQHNCNFISVIPNNLYGPNDNYDIESGHVIPSLIRRFYECIISNQKEIVIWGTGTPIREFTFARDAAQIILWLADRYNHENPINIGNTNQVSIKDLVSIISEEINFSGTIRYDSTKPDGQYKKPSSNEKLIKEGWMGEYTDLRLGIRNTIDHFKKHYPNVRGVKV